MFVLSGFSLWLTFAGFYSILTCFIPAYFVYRAVFGEEGGREGGRVLIQAPSGYYSSNVGICKKNCDIFFSCPKYLLAVFML